MKYETNEPDKNEDAIDLCPYRRDGWLDDLLTEVAGDPLLSSDKDDCPTVIPYLIGDLPCCPHDR